MGKIIEVEDHEAARKPMYKLKIDLGDLGIRNVIAGIKNYYSKEELLNSSVIVVTNLDPRSIAGSVSEGMVLAAEHDGNISLIRPDKELPPGSIIT